MSRPLASDEEWVHVVDAQRGRINVSSMFTIIVNVYLWNGGSLSSSSDLVGGMPTVPVVLRVCDSRIHPVTDYHEDKTSASRTAAHLSIS
jgi:hypothetical protein